MRRSARISGVLAGGEPIGMAGRRRRAARSSAADVVIEFSTPEATVAHARLAASPAPAT